MESSETEILEFRMTSPMNAFRLIFACVCVAGFGILAIRALSYRDWNSVVIWTVAVIAFGAMLWADLQARLQCRHQLDRQALRLRSLRTSVDLSVPIIGGVGLAMGQLKSAIGIPYKYLFPCVWDRNGVTYAMRGITVMYGGKSIEALLRSTPGQVAQVVHDQIMEWQGSDGWLASHHIEPGTGGIQALIVLRPSSSKGIAAYQVWEADKGWSDEVPAPAA